MAEEATFFYSLFGRGRGGYFFEKHFFESSKIASSATAEGATFFIAYTAVAEEATFFEKYFFET